jgi:site-specific recombinase XerD
VSDDRFPALVDAWLSAQRSDNTRSAYRTDLAAFARWCAGNERLPLWIETADVARYRAWCEANGASEASVARKLSSLRSFFRFAGYAENPAADVGGPARSPVSSTSALGPADAAALLRAADRLGPKPALLVRMLLRDGLRLHETLRVDVDDVDTDRACVRVARHGRAADVPLQRPTLRAYGRYVADRSRGPLFLVDAPGSSASRLSRYGADYLLKRVRAAAGVTVPVSANTLRRHFVASAHAAGRTLDDIRHHVGHRDVRTTRRYLIAPATSDRR